MYIEPLTLFILAEITLVYVIITAFLFYKQRLYHVLLALLKEMRWERSQRQQQKQQEMAALRAQNQALLKDVEKTDSTADTPDQRMSEQLAQHLQSLENDSSFEPPVESDDLSSSDAEQLTWLRKQVLMLEQRLLSHQITEPQWQEALSRILADSVFNPASSDKEDDTDETDLRSRLESAYDRIALMEKELMALRAINVQDEAELERPEKGMYADEIYKLKCEKFDMQEALNKARLMLQQMNPGDEGFQEQQDEHIEQLDQYIKRADMSMNLMEKELEAAHHENDALENRIKDLKNRLKDVAVTSNNANTINQDNVNQLVENASKKTAALSSLRSSIDQLRQGSDLESVLETQEGEISRLELLVRDSENCISVLEMELDNALRQIEYLSESPQASQEAPVESELGSQLVTLNEDQQNSIDNLRGHLEAIRDGGDAMEIIVQQEEEINNLQRMLKETQALVTQLQTQYFSDDVRDEAAQPKGPDSKEDMEEMEGLVKEFITDMQSMMSKIKELEAENKRLSKT